MGRIYKVKKFLTEQRKPSGAEFENIICVAYNMISNKVDKETAIQLAETTWNSSKFDPWLDVGNKIVTNSFGKNPSGVMKHYGSSNASLTDKWESFFLESTGKKAAAATKTPKTDMYIGSEHISLKKYGGSQLMSGGKAETLATFAAAYENIPENVKSEEFERGWKSLTQEISKDFTKFKLPAGKKITDFKRDISLGLKSDMINFVRSQLNKQTQMTKSLQNLLESPEVQLEVVREAMTGNQKFSESLPKSTHVMKFDEKGKSDINIIDDSYVSYVSSRTSFNISFKTAGTGKNAWTATKGIFKEEVVGDLFEEAWIHATEEYLNENVFNFLLKSAKSGINFLTNVLLKMLGYIWNKVKTIILSGLKFAQNVFGVKMAVNNPTVKF